MYIVNILFKSSYVCGGVQLLSNVRLFDPMDCTMSGSSILRYFLEFAQIYVHRVGDVI